ncbi:MAG: NAD(P)H-hydrate epimerase [Phycisphaerae bacterium]|nr:NAD(P)H-hydrate epimerase [Phycisphaerae bacterium]
MSIPYVPGDALTVLQVRELDVLAIEHVGISGLVLMENAGRNIADFVYGTLIDPAKSHVLILCGPGNNGGDGFVVARHLHNGGVSVQVALALPRDRSRGDAGVNLAVLERMDLPLIDASNPERLDEVRDAARSSDVIVDALLGTGSGGDPRGGIATLIELANETRGARRVAVDIPSGLNADTGEVGTPCFHADATVSLLAAKVGFETAAARSVLGRVIVADIGLPRDLIPRRENPTRGA